ncbi:MAG: serine/threonine-protein kinase [Acidobacteriota bacterium]|nr:serine/threonine-protein kinase [Acidobacteriota bacterium]MDH3784864.1 serine/threonine-protein kinase [Acidobacteriota bacterium]
MESEYQCPNCGGPIPKESADCPTCLMQLALDTPDVELPRSADSNQTELEENTMIGPYRIIRLLGEGGMGRVYLAQQSEPVSRQVAIKVIKHGMDTEQVVARFEVERQALALMDHPSIARVLEAGKTDAGLPYFAMDYIEGEPITDYCDRHRLALPARLDLFVQVCDAIQHAHQKGVIHRDIKPSNVLVAEQDGKPLCKVIDFGVAKAIELRLTERSLFTEIGVLIGTPEYMSPEQAELKLIDVDTRSDVYSLGVLLYNLITGFLPLEREELREAALGEVLRRVREDRPSRPSTRISEAGAKAIDPANLRRLDASALQRLVSGDLDVITLKALEKDRDQRYSSPAELAADLGRHLRNEPVLARPPSAVYQLRKWILRHKLSAAMAVLILVGLIGVTIAMTVLYGNSQRNLGRALEAESTHREVSQFMVGVFDVSHPSVARGNSVTARELLDQARARISSELGSQPEVQATLMATMGELYFQLGLLDRSVPLLEEAVDHLTTLRGSEHEETLRATSTLGQVLGRQGEWDNAEAMMREVLESQQRVLGAENVDTLMTQGNLGSFYLQAGRLDEAEALLESTLASERQVFGNEYEQTLNSMNNLGQLYIRQGRFEEADTLLNEALETFRRVFGDDHPGTLYPLYNLGESQRRQGNLAGAEPLMIQSVEANERILGPDHSETLGALNGLAILYARQSLFDKAEPVWLDVLARQEKLGRSDHPDTLSWAGNLAYMYGASGQPEKAEPLLVSVLKSKQNTMGVLHPKTLNSLMNLVEIYRTTGRPELAEPLLVDTIATWRDTPSERSPMIGVTLYNLANVMRDNGRYAQAEVLYDEAQELLESLVDADHEYLKANADERAELERKKKG